MGNPLPVNTVFDSTIVTPFTEEETDELTIAAEPVGGVTAMDLVNDLTYIDVLITPRVKGGRSDLAVGAVPEPSTFALVSVVLMGAAAVFCHRRK